ncbi:MAG TPA: enoyl-CoA hydratase/isomerase family protein [Sandaracinaceae bacterium LLY-WYZ-13_1]|nr:enoyl-CoA hydratase/isomerase family protein [Sandaracinaceae bacterium LLY-WYZ-13_1]
MSDARVTVTDEGAVRVLTLNRPAKKNAFDVEQAERLWEAIEAADADESVRVVVVTGAGDHFSAGADVSIFLNMSSLDPARLERVARLYRPLRACRTPTVAMLQGHCVGMGVTVLPHFDLVYAADHVTFTTPFVRLGLVLEYGSAHTLSRLIGLSRAKELILRAAPLDASTAADWGLVTRVFSADTLRERTMAIAAEIAAHPPGAVAESKALLDRGVELGFEQTVEAEDAALAVRYGSEENVKAVMAIMERKQKRG